MNNIVEINVPLCRSNFMGKDFFTLREIPMITSTFIRNVVSTESANDRYRWNRVWGHVLGRAISLHIPGETLDMNSFIRTHVLYAIISSWWRGSSLVCAFWCCVRAPGYGGMWGFVEVLYYCFPSKDGLGWMDLLWVIRGLCLGRDGSTASTRPEWACYV
jgi:hypothetical protein